jgi:beta-glucosidase-like glycosyl hydrolase
VLVKWDQSLAWVSVAFACKTLHLAFDLVSHLSSFLHLCGTNSVKADYVSAFPSGVNVAATWSRTLAYARGHGMGSEHRGKGVDVQLGPVCGPLGRSPEGGRNWVRLD